MELSQFDVLCFDDEVLVQWSTASEYNSSYFAVERSLDGIHFDVIGTVNAQGNSQTTHHYLFRDKDPINAVRYYRLRQFDMDGASEKSTIRSSECNTSELITFYPNPSDGKSVLMLSLDQKTDIGYSVVDDKGKLVSQGERTMEGISSIDLDLTDVNPGVYYIQVHVGDYTEVIKWVIIP